MIGAVTLEIVGNAVDRCDFRLAGFTVDGKIAVHDRKERVSCIIVLPCDSVR